ncbi:hypothetical protein Q3G72_028708 [Acer saccharum]|nr:hypothetical protein Q3G72_028708 [Acer saccharum]
MAGRGKTLRFAKKAMSQSRLDGKYTKRKELDPNLQQAAADTQRSLEIGQWCVGKKKLRFNAGWRRCWRRIYSLCAVSKEH